MQMHLFPFYVVSEFVFYSLSEKYLFMPEVNMFPIGVVLI